MKVVHTAPDQWTLSEEVPSSEGYSNTKSTQTKEVAVLTDAGLREMLDDLSAIEAADGSVSKARNAK